MIGFEEEFEVAFQMSEQEFSAYLLSIVDTDLDELFASLANTNKPFRGNVKFNRFKLIPIQTFFKRTSGLIQGEYKCGDGKLLVKGKVSNDKLLLVLSISLVIMGVAVLTDYIFTTPEDEVKLVAMVLFFLMGIGNVISTKRNVKRLKIRFLNKLEMAIKEKKPKS